MSVQKLKKSPKDVAAANGSVSATVKKAFKTNSNWEDKVSSYPKCAFTCKIKYTCIKIEHFGIWFASCVA